MNASRLEDYIAADIRIKSSLLFYFFPFCSDFCLINTCMEDKAAETCRRYIAIAPTKAKRRWEFSIGRCAGSHEELLRARRDRMLIPLGAPRPEIWTGLVRMGVAFPKIFAMNKKKWTIADGLMRIIYASGTRNQTRRTANAVWPMTSATTSRIRSSILSISLSLFI